MYDLNHKIHKSLVELSKTAHKLAYEDKEEKMIKIEEEIDDVVAKLYNLKNKELEEIKKSLAILEGREVDEEEVEEELEEVKVDFIDAVVRPKVVGSLVLGAIHPLKEIVTIELQLPKRPIRLETVKDGEIFYD